MERRPPESPESSESVQNVGSTAWSSSAEADEAARRLVQSARQWPLPPASHDRARVWARVAAASQPRTRRPWVWASLGALGAAAVALLLTVALTHRTRAALRGDQTVAVGEPLLAAGQKVLGLTVVELPETARLVIVGDTVARLDRFTADEAELTIERGSVLLHVLPRGSRQPLMIHTPGFTARVVGTVLRVEVAADGASSLAVGHGAVAVTPTDGNRQPLLVRSGERWPATSPLRNVPAPSELTLLGAAHDEGVTVAAFAVAPQLDRCGDGVGAPACLSARAALERDPVAAESDLYQAGWIAARRANDPAAALALWQAQGARFPDGVLRRERLTSMLDAQVALGRNREALASIGELLRLSPAGVRAAELHFVRGTLLAATDGDCRRAASELALALKHPAAPWSERARQALARCQHPAR